MTLPQFAISRPITILMVVSALILIGAVSIFYLPVELMPNISFDEISIIVRIRGGIPPSEVEEKVTKPIEEAVGDVSRLEEMLSISKEGESTIILGFKPGTNMNFAAMEVREKFAKVKNDLPPEIEKPVIANYKYSDYPIMILSLTSKRYSPEYIRRLVDERIEERIKRVGGVANVDVGGGRERKILVEVDQRRLAAHSLSLSRIVAVLKLNNLNLLAGDFEKEKEKYLLRTIGEFETVSEIKNIGVSTSPEGSIIRLKDVADVKDSYLEPTSFARLNVRPVVSIFIQKESTANTIRVIDKINRELEYVKTDILDKHIKMATTFNQAEFIRSSINRVKIALLQGAILATLILLLFLTNLKSSWYMPIFILMISVLFVPPIFLYIILFSIIVSLLLLRNLRFILIISLAIPISVMATFVLMYLVSGPVDITLNIMTLAGLALGIGMLVDNGIVVLENITRHRQTITEPGKAAIIGSREVTMPILAGTLTTVVAFLPVIFVNVQMRILYGPFALTVIFSLLASLAVAVSVVPLLSSKTQSMSRTPKWIATFTRTYKKALFKALKNRYKILLIVLGLFFAAVALFMRLDREFLGTAQQSDFTIFVRMPTGARLEMSDVASKKVEEILRAIPEVKSFSSHVEPWISKVYVKLVPSTERKKTTKELIEIIRRQTDKVKVFYPLSDRVAEPPFIYFEEPQEVGTKEVFLEVFGYDYKILRELAIAMSQRMNEIKGLTDVKIRMREGQPEAWLIVDKQKAALFGLDTNEIAQTIHGQMRGWRATYYHTEGKEVETIARLDEKYRRTFKDLRYLVLNTPEGEDIFLKDTLKEDIKFPLGPSEIWRKNRSRMIQLSASIGAISLGKAVKQIKQAISDIEFPEDYFYRFGGNYPELIKSQKQYPIIIFLMIALVYMVLAGFFESYTQPLILMFSIPLIIIGVATCMLIARVAVSLVVIFGLVILGGVVVNNAIILVDRANHLRKKGLKAARSIIGASEQRLRPILMTTSTTVIGLLPLALDRSESANLWSPLALTVVSGLLSSTILTLFVVPSVYLMFEDITDRFWSKPSD